MSSRGAQKVSWKGSSLLPALALVIAGCASDTRSVTTKPSRAARPNVVIIVADDLGFSDLGAFGGEIDTPNLDALANAGLRLADFHAAPACSPTRSMLLSGTDNHTAGVGTMLEVGGPEDHRAWGYEGVLTPRVATLAERLRDGGYHTVMSGKWHLGLTADQNPHARGFERSFALLQGAHNHFGKGGFGPAEVAVVDATYTDDGRTVPITEEFYSSDYFTTKLLDKLADAPGDRPFFAYLAFTAPHSPLQAPKDLIAKYSKRYDAGWAVLREQRLARMKTLGLVPPDVIPHPLVPDADAWNKLGADQQRIESRKMAIYAAMVDRLDQNVGRLVAFLKRTGQYDNTIFLFTSDNGPAGETAETFAPIPGEAAYIARADNSLENMGSATSFVFYGRYWAQAASAPFRLHKAAMTEGGTRVAAFITYPGFQRQRAIGREFANVMDILPTVLDATDSAAANVVDGKRVAEIRGRSMLPYLLARQDNVHTADEAVSLEFFGQRAVRQGDLKLMRLPAPFGDNRWTLYDLAADPAERIDVSERHPEQRRSMLAAWDAYASEVQIPDAP